MGTLASALEGIAKLDGVQGVLIVALGGELLESIVNGGVDVQRLAGLAAGSMEEGERAAGILGRGERGQCYAEYQGLNITFDPLPRDRCLVVAAKSGTNLGRIRYEIKRSRKLLEEIPA